MTFKQTSSSNPEQPTFQGLMESGVELIQSHEQALPQEAIGKFLIELHELQPLGKVLRVAPGEHTYGMTIPLRPDFSGAAMPVPESGQAIVKAVDGFVSRRLARELAEPQLAQWRTKSLVVAYRPVVKEQQETIVSPPPTRAAHQLWGVRAIVPLSGIVGLNVASDSAETRQYLARPGEMLVVRTGDRNPAIHTEPPRHSFAPNQKEAFLALVLQANREGLAA